jgi:hypothetical protein
MRLEIPVAVQSVEYAENFLDTPRMDKVDCPLALKLRMARI